MNQNFINFDIHAKQLFDSFSSNYPHKLSDMIFTNLYMWKDYFQLRYCLLDQNLWVASFKEDKLDFLFPPVGELHQGLLSHLEEIYINNDNKPITFKRVNTQFLEFMVNNASEKIQYKENREDFDYLYPKENFIKPSGCHLRMRRNQINHFYLNNPDWSYQQINLANGGKEVCEKFLTELYPSIKEITYGIAHELEALKNLLSAAQHFSLMAGILKINNHIHGLLIAEILNDNTVVFHIEKTCKDIKGVCAVLKQQFCKSLGDNIQYINMEQDLGLPGLRNAKESYQPIELLKKYELLLSY